MLSCLLLGVRVMLRCHDLHGRHHISVCGLSISTGRRPCFCCTMSIVDPQSFSFRSSGDWWDAVAKQESSRALYVCLRSGQCSGKGGEAGLDPICSPVPYF